MGVICLFLSIQRIPLEVHGETLPLITHNEDYWAPMQRVYRRLESLACDPMFSPPDDPLTALPVPVDQ